MTSQNAPHTDYAFGPLEYKHYYGIVQYTHLWRLESLRYSLFDADKDMSINVSGNVRVR